MQSKIQVYAVVRIDEMQATEQNVTIKEILPTLEEAVQEVERLNNLNKEKNAYYFWQVTRYFPNGKNAEAQSGVARNRTEADSAPIQS